MTFSGMFWTDLFLPVSTSLSLIAQIPKTLSQMFSLANSMPPRISLTYLLLLSSCCIGAVTWEAGTTNQHALQTKPDAGIGPSKQFHQFASQVWQDFCTALGALSELRLSSPD